MIDYFSDSDKSEQLSERQKIRLEVLKQKSNERDDKSAQKNMNEDRKRGPDVNVQENSADTTEIQNFDNELWFTFATKAMDSGRDKKRHKENE